MIVDNFSRVGLQMRHKPPRRRVSAKLRDDRTAATRPNQCWSMDFMADELFDGRRLRLLTTSRQ
jgi:putative transposase